MKEVKVLRHGLGYGGKVHKKGARIQMSNKHADLLVILGKVSVVDPEPGKPNQQEQPMSAKDMRPESRKVRREREAREKLAEPPQGKYLRSDITPSETRSMGGDSQGSEDSDSNDNGGTES